MATVKQRKEELIMRWTSYVALAAVLLMSGCRNGPSQTIQLTEDTELTLATPRIEPAALPK